MNDIDPCLNYDFARSVVINNNDVYKYMLFKEEGSLKISGKKARSKPSDFELFARKEKVDHIEIGSSKEYDVLYDKLKKQGFEPNVFDTAMDSETKEHKFIRRDLVIRQLFENDKKLSFDGSLKNNKILFKL